MALDLPDGARRFFDGESETLIGLLKAPAAEHEAKVRELEEMPESVERIRSADIRSFASFAIGDMLGNENAIYFSTSQGWLGFTKERYPAYHKVVNALAGRAELRDQVGSATIMNAMIAWLKGRTLGDAEAEVGFSTFLLREVERLIRPCEVSVPIDNLRIGRDLRLANVVFRTFDAEHFEAFGQRTRPADPALLERQGTFLTKMRRAYEGHVFAVITVEADRQRALEVALEETESALVALRAFSMAAYVPEAPCYVGIRGRVWPCPGSPDTLLS
jgi:hypothetical protein